MEPQLLHSIGLDKAEWLKRIAKSLVDHQETKFIVASAASGCGNTNGAYAAGKIVASTHTVLSIVIRVAEPHNSVVEAEPQLSRPFDQLQNLLYSHLTFSIMKKSDEADNSRFSSMKKMADKALRLVKLLLATYVEATVEAISRPE